LDESRRLKGLIEKRKIVRIEIDRDLIEKEMNAAKYDSEKAKKSFNDKDFKWTTVKAYYSMFYSARALLFSKGFREKSHRALAEAIVELFVKTNVLEESFVDRFLEAMELREEADYGLVYSEESADDVIKNAEKFLRRVEGLLS